VISTLWEIDDKLSSALMIRFYEQLAKGETNLARALAEAQREQLHESGFGDWAAFQCLGLWTNNEIHPPVQSL
jgi:CHAT domain-containing protein